ncbi:flagellar hook-associated protein FlgK [Virgibacillus sp. YIM 98842]|uniref:flagellar hook-associated protein FlgK n=1 Tax=Virgibacillus sp. YIM 98842 TaxID=2663533 RepID=UPI0013D91DED|nr:flagellar hook-associated protein FlgK [Virgibacillus sp. YIM 98842]
MSTFHGLEMAKQALFAQRSALHTTGHNISNANTEGYTRQRVNFETMSPYPAGARNRPEIPGQLGTGVQAGSIERIRDQFLDNQFRAENGKSGYWETLSSALGRMENIMNEPSESGLSHTMDQFWQSLQDLAVSPDNSGARSVVAERGLAVSETFNYLADSLTTIRSDLKNQIDVTVADANSLMRQIHGVNEQIKQLEPHGYLPNDLYDERDRLIDDLSNMMNIKVTYEKSGESSPDIAKGLASIEVINNQGHSFDPPVTLVNGAPGQGAVNEIEIAYGGETGSLDAVESISAGGVNLDILDTNGSLGGLIEAYGHSIGENDNVTGIYTTMLANLDDMANAFAEAFNEVHQNGRNLDDEPGEQFFVFKEGLTGARGLTVNQDILDYPEKIAASADGTQGNGANATELAAVFNNTNLEGDPLGENTSVNSFYQSIIGELGVAAQEANRMTNNTEILRSQVENQRMSVSSVSLDEEMSNMIKFQHAYNASARSMTAMDELLDRIINNMGLAGR